MIKVILFDFTGVVVTGGHKKLCKILAEKYHLPAEEIYEVLYTKYFNSFAENKISEQVAYEEPIKIFSFKETWQELAEMYLRTHVINPPMVEYIGELKKKYKCVLLTKNIKRYLAWEREKFGLDALFDDIINTQEINLPKASVETLNYVFDRFQVKPPEVLYVDDQESNLTDAKKLSVHTVFYQTFEQVKSEFEKIFNLLI